MIGKKENFSKNLINAKLLNYVRIHWLLGDWQEVINVKENDIEDSLERAKIFAFVASAYQNIGNMIEAKKYFSKAMKKSYIDEFIKKLCISDLYNKMGILYAIYGLSENVQDSFRLSLEQFLQDEDLKTIAHHRSISELARVGLLSNAAKFIGTEIKEIENSFSTQRNLESKIKILKTEMELLTHELRLSQQRKQLYFSTQDIVSQQKNLDINLLKERSVSQLGQDIWVLEKTNFKRDGFFVEFGATDGILLSNTYLLEQEFGWNGICAEPNPKFYKELEKNRKCQVSNACIGAKTGEVVEFIFAQEYGGMKKHASADNHAMKRKAYEQEDGIAKLVTISLDDFLIKMGAPKHIDYLSVDTEGSEYEILEKFPFDEWEIDLITVEHNNTKYRDKIYKILSKEGYTRMQKNWDDWYYKEITTNEI